VPEYKLTFVVEGKDRGGASVLGGLTKGLGGIAAIVAGGVLAKELAETVGVAADFQTQVARLSVAAGGAGTSLDVLHSAALQVGADTSLLGVSASGAAESMTGLYKAGLSTTEIFGDLQGYMAGTAKLGGALRAAIDLAAATELDMVQASDLAAVTLATFGGELETEAERASFITSAMDNFVKAADASVAEVSDLSMAMMNIGPVAASFGFDLEDVNTALALLSTRGISGSEAGTALRSMLTNMMRDTESVKDSLMALNIELYNADGTMRSLPEIVGMFSESLAGLTEEERNHYVQTIAGTYGMRALSTLLAEGTEGWNGMTVAISEATGIQEQAEVMAGTFQGRMEALEGTVETLKIGIGEALLPVLTDLANMANELMAQYGPQLTAAFAEVGAWLSQALPKAIRIVGAVWSNLLQPAFEGLADLMSGTLKPILIAVGVVIAAMNLPIILLGAAVIALGLIWKEHGDQVRVIVEQLGVIVGYVFREAIQWVRDFGGTVADVFRRAWEWIKNLIDKLVSLRDKLRTIKLPDWLTPGSPTPFELGLRGIASALDEVNGKMGSGPLISLGGAGVGGGGGPHYHLHVHSSAPTEPIVADFRMLEAMAA